jgi:hypothetical protein
MQDDHDHDDHGHDDHGDHPADDPRWVLLALAAGAVIGVLLVVLLGFESGAVPTHTL